MKRTLVVDDCPCGYSECMFPNCSHGRLESHECTRYGGRIVESVVQGAGPVWKLFLSTWSEDGMQEEFTGEFFAKHDAERLLDFWRLGGHEIVLMAANLTSAMPQEPEDEG